MKTLSVVLMGAGMRGETYTNIMLNSPEKFKVVAVAEPVEGRRNKIKKLHNIPEDMCFNSWEDVLAKPKMADIALICTMDEMHYPAAMKAIELGYDIILEKPVAPTAKECADILAAAKAKNVKVLVCHVLRYTPFYNRVKSILDEGMIGKVMSANFVEVIGNVHQSHSYVRGNWHSEKESSPILLAKSCHDIDIIQWLLNKKCISAQSFGELSYFNKENAPKGAPVRCIDGGCPIEDTCSYNCKKLYYDAKGNSWFRTASTKGIAKTDVPTDDEVMQALKTTDYGLCVFHANNDVLDHQIVNMQFEGGATVSFNMNAFGIGGRHLRIFGTEGELYAGMGDDEIIVRTFQDWKDYKIPVNAIDESILSGHGGGDQGLVYEAFEYFSGSYNGNRAADIDISVKNHFICFAAEQSRKSNTVVSVDDFCSEYDIEY
jgi:predicted dehydrogenase